MLTYLAAPYYHADPEIPKQRMITFYQIDAALSAQGLMLVSPLYKVETAKHGEIPDTFNFWERYCYEMLAVCGEMIIILMDGWNKSSGVKAEIKYCQEHQIPIRYYDPATQMFVLCNELVG